MAKDRKRRAPANRRNDSTEDLLRRLDAAQQEIANLTSRLDQIEGIVNAAPLAIVTNDRRGRIVDWNPAAEAMFGWRAAEVISRVDRWLAGNWSVFLFVAFSTIAYPSYPKA